MNTATRVDRRPFHGKDENRIETLQRLAIKALSEGLEPMAPRSEDNEPLFSVTSSRNVNIDYTVTPGSKKYGCTCEGYAVKYGYCKHYALWAAALGFITLPGDYGDFLAAMIAPPTAPAAPAAAPAAPEVDAAPADIPVCWGCGAECELSHGSSLCADCFDAAMNSGPWNVGYVEPDLVGARRRIWATYKKSRGYKPAA